VRGTNRAVTLSRVWFTGRGHNITEILMIERIEL